MFAHTRAGLVALFAGLAMALATSRGFADEELFLGTWVLNAAKSKGPATVVPESATMVISDLGSGKYKSVTDNVAARVKTHVEVTFATDGKDYPLVTTPTVAGMPPVTQSFERVNATTYKVSLKVNGQLMATALEEVSADGKTLTATTMGIGQFATISNVTVFDRK
jgi:hypothetical protein